MCACGCINSANFLNCMLIIRRILGGATDTMYTHEASQACKDTTVAVSSSLALSSKDHNYTYTYMLRHTYPLVYYIHFIYTYQSGLTLYMLKHTCICTKRLLTDIQGKEWFRIYICMLCHTYLLVYIYTHTSQVYMLTTNIYMYTTLGGF